MKNLGYWIVLMVEIIIITILIIMTIRSFKKSKSIYERSLFIIFLILAICILVLYWFDTFNVPTIFGINRNLDSQNWLSVITTFASVIISELLAGLFLIFVTSFQIQENRKDMLEKEKEDRRIGNMPLLSYNFSNDYIYTENVYKLKTNESEKDIHFVLSITNIGMNAIRKCYVQLKGESLVEYAICELGQQSCLNKNDTRHIYFDLSLNFGKHNYKAIIYYEDLLHNWYMQTIDYELDIKGNKSVSFIENKFKVNDEKMIEKPELKQNVE